MAGPSICIIYNARWTPAYLRCTQCSILLHLVDICFLSCICLWQILHIQTYLCVVVGPGFVSTSPALMRSSASHPAGPHGQLAKKGEIGPPWVGAGGFDTICTVAYPSRCDSSTTILLHLIDIYFLSCICLWQILHIQTYLCVVVGPGFVSTSPALMRSSASL